MHRPILLAQVSLRLTHIIQLIHICTPTNTHNAVAAMDVPCDNRHVVCLTSTFIQQTTKWGVEPKKISYVHIQLFYCLNNPITDPRPWQYELWSFQMGGTKLERFLPMNQHTQRKLLNLENWVSGEVSKIGHNFSK